jgi:hypothetical protein
MPRPSGSCSSSVRVNTRGLPGDRPKGKKAALGGRSGLLRGPLPPGDAGDSGRAAARCRLRASPRAAPPHACGLPPCWLGPWGDAQEHHLTPRPAMAWEPRRHGGGTGRPRRCGAAAVGHRGRCGRGEGGSGVIGHAAAARGPTPGRRQDSHPMAISPTGETKRAGTRAKFPQASAAMRSSSLVCRRRTCAAGWRYTA